MEPKIPFLRLSLVSFKTYAILLQIELIFYRLFELDPLLQVQTEVLAQIWAHCEVRLSEQLGFFDSSLQRVGGVDA